MKKIFFFLMIASLTGLSKADAQDWWKSKIRGEGPTVTQDLDLPAFDAIKLSMDADVYVRQGSQQSVRIEAQQNMIDNIKKEVSDNTWRITTDRWVTRHDPIKIYITIPKLTEASVSGSGNLMGETAFSGSDRFMTGVSGSGNVKLEITCDELDARVSGSGNVRLAGSTGSLTAKISGSGNIKAEDLAAKTCNVQVSGSGNSSVNVSDELDVKISGSGDVSYKGRPKVSSRISGSGDLVSRN